jgi:branched-chain amino acid transport system ATP-binding protein
MSDLRAALELRDISAGYGPFRALFGVSLTLQPGHALALIGPNGAGKTTVARVASGLVSPTEGTVEVDGTEVTRWRPYRIADAGVAHAPEGRSVFASLTVEENLTLSFRRTRGRAGVRSGLDLAFDLFPILRDRRKQAAGTLSGGEQRMLAMARVMVELPKVLVADELSLGLAPIVVDKVYDALAKLRDHGVALLIVEQHVTHALDLCQQAALLDHGTITWAGSSTEAAELVRTQIFDLDATADLARERR